MTGFWSTETIQNRVPGENLIDPYDPELIANCSYELRLGREVYVTGESSKTKRTLKESEQVRISPGQFANLLTEETVHIPPDALGLISAKFRWKQRGLVNVSGFHVDPGYTGKLLFSVYNAGPTPVVVERGNPLFLLWFCALDQSTNDTYRRTPRCSITSEDVSHLQGDVASPQALAKRVEQLERVAAIGRWLIGAIVLALIGAIIAVVVQAIVEDDSNTDGLKAPWTATSPPSTAATPYLPVTSVLRDTNANQAPLGQSPVA